MLKYDPLEMHLLCLPPGLKELTLSFAQVEQIIAAKLPPSAYTHPAWWANERKVRHASARAWRDVGWLVAEVDQGQGWVRFVRQ